MNLGAIPIIDIAGGGASAGAAARPQGMADLIAVAERDYGKLGLATGDRVARWWLARTNNPFLGELDALAATLGRPGAYALNVSYEFACTSGACPSPGGGNRLLRVLDWAMEGLGRTLVAFRQSGPAGPYVNLAWPGFAGVVTALAKGRFAAAINQPPMTRHGLGWRADWLIGHAGLLVRNGLPPAHLLRRVFETAPDYRTAQRRLAQEPVCMPVFFTLCGPGEGEACVIERAPGHSVVHGAPAAVANHWLAVPLKGHPRGPDSVGRLRSMQAVIARPQADLDWLTPPILNRYTRMAAVLCPATGHLVAQGWEEQGPATAVLDFAV